MNAAFLGTTRSFQVGRRRANEDRMQIRVGLIGRKGDQVDFNLSFSGDYSSG